MIFKLTFNDDDGRIDWCQAKNMLHLLQSFEKECGDFQDVKEVIEISEEEAKSIMLKNSEYDETDPTDSPEYSLFDGVMGDDFCIVGSTEFCEVLGRFRAAPNFPVIHGVKVWRSYSVVVVSGDN